MMLNDQFENTEKIKKENGSPIKDQKEDEKTEETPDISASIEKKGSYANTTSDKARTHKGPIGIDRDPNSI